MNKNLDNDDKKSELKKNSVREYGGNRLQQFKAASQINNSKLEHKLILILIVKHVRGCNQPVRNQDEQHV